MFNLCIVCVFCLIAIYETAIYSHEKELLKIDNDFFASITINFMLKKMPSIKLFPFLWLFSEGMPSAFIVIQ